MRKYLLVPLLIIAVSVLGYFSVASFPKISKALTSGVTLSAAILTYITTAVDSATKAFGNVTPGTVSYATSTVTTLTNSQPGYNVKVNRDDSDTTIDKVGFPAVNFPDYTDWSAGGDKITAGNATSTANLGYKLAFRVSDTSTACGFSSTWWGTDASAKLYAGFPAAAETTFDCDAYTASYTNAAHEFRINATTSQETGTYDGGITYTVTANP